MINRPQQGDGQTPPDLLGQFAAAAGVTPGGLMGRPEVARVPESDLLAMAREASGEAPRPTPEYSTEYAEWLIEEAERGADALTSSDEVELIRSQIVECYCILGDFGAATSVYRRISKAYYKIFAEEYLAKELVRAGKIDEAYQIAPKWLPLISEICKQPQKIGRARGMASALMVDSAKIEAAGILAKAGDTVLLEEIKAEFNITPQKGSELEALKYCQALIKSGDDVGAQDWIKRRRWEDEGTMQSAVADVAGALAAKGQLDEAEQIAASLRSDSSGEAESCARHNMVVALITTGQMGEAQKVADGVLGDNWKYSVNAKLANGYAKAGDLERADEISRNFNNEFDFDVMISAAAGGMLVEAMRRAQKCEDPTDQAEAYAKIATIVAKRAQGIEDD